MIDKSIQEAKREEKERVRRRMKVKVDPTKYEYIPAKQTLDYYDNEAHLRVVIYVRVSTDNVKQTTSFELQKKYYEDFVTRHPNWDLVAIYQDEGISGTSLRKRDGFNRMIADAKAGLFDIITVIHCFHATEIICFLLRFIIHDDLPLCHWSAGYQP